MSDVSKDRRMPYSFKLDRRLIQKERRRAGRLEGDS